jgi:Iron-containing redox enzyme
MPVAADRIFVLPDTIAALPRRPFEFSPGAREAAAALLDAEPDALLRGLLRDQESEGALLAARRVIGAFLGAAGAAGRDGGDPGAGPDHDAAAIAARLATARATLAAVLGPLREEADPQVREAVLRQRAPLGMLGGCWLEVLSQPATQPSTIVNALYAQYFTLLGSGDPLRAARYLRRRALEAAGVQLPDIGAADLAAKAGIRPLTALHGVFYLALSRLPANFLPEVVGVHVAFHALGVDDLLLGIEQPIAQADLVAVLTQFLGLAGPDDRERMLAGLRLTLALEHEHVTMLAELAAWHRERTLESRVAEIVARHAPMAGSQHQEVRVGGELLAETFGKPHVDIAAFLAEFRESKQLRPWRGGDSRFIRAIKFGGPMYGIFDEGEAAVFKAWVESVQAGERPPIRITPDTVGDAQAAVWRDAIERSAPQDVVFAEPGPFDDRELFHRLANIENFPNVRPAAIERAERTLAAAEVLFTHGAGGRYTDATWFDYDADALYQRAEQVYWEKLIKPYRPLTEIPERDEVVFLQTTYALGALIDGTWLHRLAGTGHDTRPSDPMLLSIYADEMGHGDLAKNHLTLIHTALASMDVRLPHIRDEAFKEQGDLPDELYGFSLHQLCLAMFPDRYYNELLGYNLAIEMFGLGEMRLHEVQKLRHYGFDVCYEQAHLTIDNISAGHTKQAADIIVAYLDHVQRNVGDAAVQQEWRRIWRGYASYAYFVEHALLKKLAAGQGEPAGESVGESAGQSVGQSVGEPAGEPAGESDDVLDLMI